MKSIYENEISKLPGKRILSGDSFNFRCHAELGCFNKCCRNLNLFLYPYDVIKLKQNLKLTSDEFINKHVDIVLRESNFFPDVLLKMSENNEKTCPYLTEKGCSVYMDRPDSCRTFPVEQGVIMGESPKERRVISFFKPPVFCDGQHEEKQWTIRDWEKDQNAEIHHKMTALWSELKILFMNNPWGTEGPEGQKAKMAFMAAYNIDSFRTFVFESSFLNRYKIKRDLLTKIKKNDIDMMKFGFSWIKFFLWGIKSKKIRLRVTK